MRHIRGGTLRKERFDWIIDEQGKQGSLLRHSRGDTENRTV